MIYLNQTRYLKLNLMKIIFSSLTIIKSLLNNTFSMSIFIQVKVNEYCWFTYFIAFAIKPSCKACSWYGLLVPSTFLCFLSISSNSKNLLSTSGVNAFFFTFLIFLLGTLQILFCIAAITVLSTAYDNSCCNWLYSFTYLSTVFLAISKALAIALFYYYFDILL